MLPKTSPKVSHIDILISFFLLGLTSFGGPIAHISYFRNTFVKDKKWIDDDTYMEFVSLCNFLPGPSSSQVGMSIGYHFKGVSGAILAWVGFTIPSAFILILFGYFVINFDDVIPSGFIQGLKSVVVIIVLQAILGMQKNFLKDFYSYSIAFFTALILILFPSSLNQLLCLIMSGLLGMYFYKDVEISETSFHKPISITLSSYIFLFLFFSFLFFLPIINSIFETEITSLANIFYKVGSLVFGGGHVVLPLLQEEFVSKGLIEKDIFLAGYGAAQAIPGPLFTFSSYLGIFLANENNFLLISILCLIFIFLPSFFLIIGTLPIWSRIRKIKKVVHAFKAINASVIGILVAAFYDPIILSSFKSVSDFILIFIAFIILFLTKTPQWLAVLMLIFCGFGLSVISF
ncbi:chromate efflux transporter [Alphaproteobacteria bacterium]|nr:chromate efflux transporter [Alphaproteobacteria bacterium]